MVLLSIIERELLALEYQRRALKKSRKPGLIQFSYSLYVFRRLKSCPLDNHISWLNQLANVLFTDKLFLVCTVVRIEHKNEYAPGFVESIYCVNLFFHVGIADRDPETSFI